MRVGAMPWLNFYEKEPGWKKSDKSSDERDLVFDDQSI